MKKLWEKFGWIVMTVVGSVIFGASYGLFLGPNQLNAGGISGLAAVIVEFVKLLAPDFSSPLLTVGTLTVIINLPLFAVGGLKIGKRFFFGSLLGMFLSSFVIDNFPWALQVEPLMAAQSAGGLLTLLFGSGKGSGASLLYALIGLGGVAVVSLFALDREIWKLDKE